MKKEAATGKLIARGVFELIRYPGKGGWTYLKFRRPPDLPKTAWGAGRVKGSIDDHHFEGLTIWSTSDGHLFFPVKAEIRKIIGKKEGDRVKVAVYQDRLVPELPEDLELLLKEEPGARKKFDALTPGRQRQLILSVTAAKKDQTRVDRLAEVLNFLARC
jgi:hypothetical protein